MSNLQSMKFENVMSVYSGKANKCCCGCSGSHRYNARKVKEASKHRGYKVTPDEVNDKQVRKVLKIVQQQDSFFPVLRGNTYFSCDVEQRMLTVYVA